MHPYHSHLAFDSNNLYEYLLQLIAILLMNGLVAAFPIMHWLKKPIQELKKER